MVSEPHTPTSSRRAVAITPAGVLGTVLIAAVVIVFLRLGFWQLDRLGQRRELNAGIAARMEAPALRDVSRLADTAGLFFRVVHVAGTFDNDRSIVLPGRSYRGVPGVHLLTPLRLPDGRGILVNRGWVPSADAASLDLAQLDLADSAAVRGLLLPFPSQHESLARRDTLPAARAAFRRVWFTIDEAALRAQFPYELLPATVQELPHSDAAGGAPTRLPPPALDEGSHLGYALQWFSFAAIALIGWLALVLRSRAPRRLAPVLAALFLSLAATPARAQLRPLDPLDWRIFDPGVVVLAQAGVGVLWDQHATLAGAHGRLLEAGNYALAVRSGRIAIDVSGTAIWHFVETAQTAAPAHGVLPARDGVRRDAGAATAATAFRISLPRWTTDVVLRFGASIPTTSDESGLDRDRTDFFATLALRYPRGPLSLWMENGIGINGTTSAEYPQSDVWTFAFGAAYELGTLRPGAALVGRQDGHSWIVRGNEDQRELRLGVDAGRTRWLSIHYILGLAPHSPAHGIRIGAGLSIGTPGKPGEPAP